MAKTIKTRIRLKYDTLTNWETNNPVLLAGEVAIATGVDLDTEDNVSTSYVLMKVGDGSTDFKSLPWISAVAADVYSWAKLSWEDFLAELGESGFDLSGYKKTQTSVTDKITDKAHVLTSLTQNANGEISYDVKILTPSDIGAQAAGNYKTAQTAVSDPTASGKSLTFIDTISQDTNGVISATKKNVNLDAYALKTDIPTIPSITITDDSSVDVPTTDTVNVYRNLTANGHTLTEDLVSVPTKAYVDKVVAGSVDYLGTVSALSGLSTSAGKGDFYRVSTAFGSCHAGDLLVAEKDKPAQLIDGTNWSLIHGEEGDITEVVAGNGLTGGGSVDSVTLNVGAGNGITVAADSVSVKAGNGITVDTNGVNHADTSNQESITANGRTYITGVTLDTYGHVTGLTTGTETVTDTHYTAKNIVGGSADAKTNAAVTAANSIYLNLIEDNTVRSSHNIIGSGATRVSSDENGNITIYSENGYHTGDFSTGLKVATGYGPSDIYVPEATRTSMGLLGHTWWTTQDGGYYFLGSGTSGGNHIALYGTNGASGNADPRLEIFGGQGRTTYAAKYIKYQYASNKTGTYALPGYNGNGMFVIIDVDSSGNPGYLRFNEEEIYFYCGTSEDLT